MQEAIKKLVRLEIMPDTNHTSDEAPEQYENYINSIEQLMTFEEIKARREFLIKARRKICMELHG